MISVLQSANGQAGAFGTGNMTVNFSSAVTAGSTLIAMVAATAFSNALALGTVTDTLNSSYSSLVGSSSSAADGIGNTIFMQEAIWMAANVSGGSDTVKLPWTGAPSQSTSWLTILEIAGLNSTPVLDSSGSTSGTTFPPTSLSVTPVAAATVALGSLVAFTTGTPFSASGGAGWVLTSPTSAGTMNGGSPNDQVYQGGEYQILSTTSPVTLTMTSPGSGVGGVAWVASGCTLAPQVIPPGNSTSNFLGVALTNQTRRAFRFQR
jgi:hypothetical protein